MDLNVSDAKDTDGNSDPEVDDTITIDINLTDVPTPPQTEQPSFSDRRDTDDTTSMLILTWVAPTVLPDGTSPASYGLRRAVPCAGVKPNWIDLTTLTTLCDYD